MCAEGERGLTVTQRGSLKEGVRNSLFHSLKERREKVNFHRHQRRLTLFSIIRLLFVFVSVFFLFLLQNHAVLLPHVLARGRRDFAPAVFFAQVREIEIEQKTNEVLQSKG